MSVVLLFVILLLILDIIILLIGIHQKNTIKICRSKKSLKGKTVLVTGGTAGMGLEISRDFAQRGARVIVACPFPKEGEQAVQEIVYSSENENVAFKLLDLSSFASVRKFAENILSTEDRLDVLVNNAAVGGPRHITHDGLNFVLQVNYYGAFLLTILLLPLLKKSGRLGEPSRIVNVSSASYILGRSYLENTCLCSVLAISYFISKLYIVIFSRELAKRLNNSHVVVNSADPGVVGTNIFLTFAKKLWLTAPLVKAFFWILFKNPWEGAQTAIHVAVDEKIGDINGKYFKNCKQVETAKIACDEKLGTEIWNKSIAVVALTDNEYLSINLH